MKTGILLTLFQILLLNLKHFMQGFVVGGHQSRFLEIPYIYAVKLAADIIPTHPGTRQSTDDATSQFVTDLAERFAAYDAHPNDFTTKLRELNPVEFKLYQTLYVLRRNLSIFLLDKDAVIEAVSGNSDAINAFWSGIFSGSGMDRSGISTLVSDRSPEAIKTAREFLMLAGFDPFKQNLFLSYPLKEDRDMRLIDLRRLVLAVAGKVQQDQSSRP